jgi:hypothetical protein
MTKENNEMTNINIPQIRADLQEIEEQIRPVKEALRSTWTKPMDNEQYQLIDLRARATELLCLLAWTRGRHHMADHERCQAIAERMAPSYQAEAA